MMGEYTQRIYRELARMTTPMAQSSLAQLCGCSLSFVNKEIKDLTKRRLLGRPSRTRISLVNRPGLLLLWIGRRDSHSNDIKRISTDLDLKALLTRISSLKRYAITMETAAFLMGIKENMTISEVTVYVPPDLMRRLNIKEGRGGVDLAIIPSSDDNLYKNSNAIDGNVVAPEAQVFVDLADWGTWSAHNLAVRLALTRDGYPVLATRQELEAFQ
jgi:hypothetical protein